MAFKRIDGTVYIDDTIEREVLRLCEEIPNLGVVCIHNNRAASAALRFYMGLDISLRRQYPMQKSRYRTDLPNGSFITFVSTFSMSESFVVRLPEDEYHIVIAYGVHSPIALVGALARIKHPGKHVGKDYMKLFPMYINGAQIHMYKDVEAYYATLYRTNDVIVDTSHVDMFKNYNQPVVAWKNVDDYPGAKEILEEESLVESEAEEYDEYLAHKAKRKRLAEKYENKRPYEELQRLREEYRGEDGVVDEDNE